MAYSSTRFLAARQLRRGRPSARQLWRAYNPKLASDEEVLPAGRMLALDVGKKRIGLAISDELGITAQGIETLERTRIRADLEKIKQVASRWNAAALLVGEPLHMSGSESRQSEYTREFAARLGEYLKLPIVFWDERLTTVEAERILRDSGASLDRRKKEVDRLAAVLLLESYLSYRRMQSEPEGGRFE